MREKESGHSIITVNNPGHHGTHKVLEGRGTMNFIHMFVKFNLATMPSQSVVLLA
jgi:hypothetical protein